MKIRVFVTSSACVLLLWLGVTYLREVPQQHYPKLGKDSQPIAVEGKQVGMPETLIGLEEGDRSDSLAEVE